MALLVITLLALLASSSIILSYNGVYGGRTLSMEEDVKLERELKHLNKPAVKSIKTEYGEIFDCVDFHKQPAFDNPLLKNHIPQMSPSAPRETLKQASSGVEHLLPLGLDGGGCPSGTVPIRRTTKEDLIRWKSYSNTSGNFRQFSLNEGPGKHFAGFQLRDENLQYHGGSMYMSLHNFLVSTDNQYSGAVMWAEGELDRIQVGSHVNPKLYGDKRAHLFGHYWTTAGGTTKTDCFNTMCPGFVQLHNELPLGLAFPKISTYNGETVDFATYLYQDKNSGNWWLSVTDSQLNVGYWPKELFSSIKEFTPVVGWRGEVYAPQGEQSPEMGTGRFPDPFGVPDTKKTAYFRAVRVLKDDLFVGPNDASLVSVSDVTKCYKAFD